MREHDIRTLPVADIELPVELERLYDLAYNLWWTWTVPAIQLFSSIDWLHWQIYRNPVQLLINVEPQRWETLRLNEAFMASYNTVVAKFDAYLERASQAWFPTRYPDFEGGPVAYVSPEFGWHECLGIYSGGLGILAGDHCKSASDEGIPFVGVGLLYGRGYFRQTIDADGNQQHFYPDYDTSRLPLLPVVARNGRPIRIAVDLPGRAVTLRAWKAAVGRVPVLLLDSDLAENDPADRPITSILYVRGREMRLCQEALLGIGAVKLLAALGIRPSVWHMNEGHSSLLALERIQDLVTSRDAGFEEARREVASVTVFTTHTPVPAGNETFERPLAARYLEAAFPDIGASTSDLLEMGRGTGDPPSDEFNLTALALRTSCRTNGVSRLHGEVVRSIWAPLWAGSTEPSPPVLSITNGVHTPSWLGPEMGDLLGRHLGRRFFDRMLDPGFADAVRAIPDGEVWSAHRAQKERLVGFVRERVRQQFARHGRSPDELRQVQDLLDPDALTIGFARRFATYKRASLLFRDRKRLDEILDGEGRTVQIVFAGKAHPADRPGQALIREIFLASLTPELRGRIVFLEDYDMLVGRTMVQGVDLWLNTPVRPLEASGTSGQKAAANGALNLSVADGWWAEGHDPSHGWLIGEDRDYGGDEDQDHLHAESLYGVLAGEIVPAYYDCDEDGIPRGWVARMKEAVATLAPRFSTCRMVRDYAELCYLPVARGEARDGLTEAAEAANS